MALRLEAPPDALDEQRGARATGRLVRQTEREGRLENCERSAGELENCESRDESRLCTEGRWGAVHLTSLAWDSKALGAQGGVSVEVRDGREVRLVEKFVEYDDMPEMESDERECSDRAELPRRSFLLSAPFTDQPGASAEPTRDAGQ